MVHVNHVELIHCLISIRRKQWEFAKHAVIPFLYHRLSIAHIVEEDLDKEED